jgi:thioesterase domain-containing protein
VIEQRLGHRPAVASLYRATTLGALAAEIDTSEAELDTSAVIPVRPSGSRAPWFCVYTDARGVVALRNIVPALLADQPVYALSAIDPRDPTWRMSTVSEIAAARVAALCKLVPGGPIRLGGHSLGGLVAFEMACQLEEAGRQVEILTLLDTRTPRGSIRNRLAFRTSRPRADRRFSSESPPLGPVKWYGDFLIEEWRILRARYANARAFRAGRVARETMDFPRGFSDPYDRWGARRLALTMSPRRFNGRLVIFRAQRSIPMLLGPDLGWSRFAARPPELVDIPGDHVTMLAETEVADLAAALGTTLESLDHE